MADNSDAPNPPQDSSEVPGAAPPQHPQAPPQQANPFTDFPLPGTGEVSPSAPGAEWSPSPSPSPDAKEFTPAAPRRLQYFPAIRYVFDHPDWLLNVTLVSICWFIPMFGPIAIYGYMYEVTEALFRFPGQNYPKFEFQRFAAYCPRGVWVYLIVLLTSWTLQFLLQMPLQLGGQMLLFFAMANPRVGAITAAIVIPIVLILVLILLLAVDILLCPIQMRAGLAQDFPLIFRFYWFKDFWRKMWREATVACLLSIVTAVIFVPLGCMMFLIGITVAWTLVYFLGAHLFSQLYMIYLERGGEPIPLKPLPAEVPPVGMP